MSDVITANSQTYLCSSHLAGQVHCRLHAKTKTGGVLPGRIVRPGSPPGPGIYITRARSYSIRIYKRRMIYMVGPSTPCLSTWTLEV